jgi:hypothetical protein
MKGTVLVAKGGSTNVHDKKQSWRPSMVTDDLKK